MTGLTMRDLGLSDTNASCSCCAAPAPTEKAAVATNAGSFSAIYRVAGMTCSHCAASVTEELREIAGITGVDVDLAADGESTVTINSTEAIDPVAVRQAVAEAGYRVVGTR